MSVLEVVKKVQMHFFSYLIVYDCKGHYGRYIPAWELTYKSPQQTVIIRMTSQGVFTKCSSFQISHLIVTVEFTPF